MPKAFEAIMPNEYTPFELMAIFLARELKDGDILRVGVAMPVVEAAVRLAHLTHGPNMELIFLGARMNVAHLDTIPLPAFGWDRRVVRWAESYSDTGHRFDRSKIGIAMSFLSAAYKLIRSATPI